MQSQSTTRNWPATIAALTAVVLWGVGIPIAKIALEEIDVLAFLLLRVFISSLLLFIALYINEGDIGVNRHDLRNLAVLGIFGIGFTHVGFLVGLSYTQASHSAALVATGPLFATLLVAILGIEQTNRRIWFGILICLFGISLLVGASTIVTETKMIAGDIIVLASALFWAIYAILSKKLLVDNSALKVTAYAFAFSNLVIFPASINAVVNQNWAALTSRTWYALAFNILLGLVIANILWLQSIKHLGVAKTSMFHYFVPVVGIVVSVLLLGESFGVREMVGSAVILLGVALATR